MKSSLPGRSLFLRRDVCIAMLILVCVPGPMKASRPPWPPLNQYGAPVLDAQSHRINYERKTLEAMARTKGKSTNLPAKAIRPRISEAMPTPRPHPTPAPRPTPQPPLGGQGLFWQYAVFGADIGGSNIIIGPVPPGGGTPEIIFDSYSYSTFWQSIRYNPSTGN